MTLVGKDGSVLVVGNGHIINGQLRSNNEVHKIPGDREAQSRFKQSAVINMIKKLQADAKASCRGRRAAPRGAFVLCGDMNLTEVPAKEALKQLSFVGVTGLCLQKELSSSNGPTQHDWIFTDRTLAEAKTDRIVSHDTQRGLVAAELGHPAPVPAAPQGLHQQKMQDLRTRLLLRQQEHHRTQEQHDRDDEEQRRLARAAERKEAAAKRRRVGPPQAGQALCIAAFVFPLRRIFESVGDRCDCDCRW